ncbi:MAG: 4-(cytidine 5'-diphospho)-2-C-methyl-D-erythritol kinase [Desulfobacteraceae bacterium]|nr:MAG: 4-(cytidine 5'-diphospho)-2-C-methyl-D-erythritol kinase [Desulfobacteraceae bacterium]
MGFGASEMTAGTTPRINASTRIELLAPAKINLFLHVLGRRDDGYHELCSLMCGVSLYDHLVLKPGTRNEMVCSHPGLPCDSSNLAFKALLAFNRDLRAAAAVTPRPISIHLTKHIPIGAGLGGGSSDAAAVLKGLNRFYGGPFDHDRLHALAVRLGADVPFFIDQRPALAEGIGERLTPYSGLPALWTVLVYPGFGLSTAAVFKNLNLALTKSKKKLRKLPFKNGNFSAPQHLRNDLEAGVGERLPVIQKIKEELVALGAIGSLMTGSGSVVYGLFPDAAGANKAKEALDGASERQVFVARLLT